MIPAQAENDLFSKPYEYSNPVNYDNHGYSLACSLGFGSIIKLRDEIFVEETPGLKKDK